MTAVRDALAFLTRLPVGPSTPLTAARLSRASALFPLVGLLVGAVMAGVHSLAALALDPLPSTLLAIVAAVVLTGGLHEDGLADVADGLGAHTTRERKLEILRDSRVGTFGALAVVVMVVFALVVLAPLDGADFARAAIVGHVLGRFTTLPLSLAMAPARPDGKGAFLRAQPAAVAVGTAIAAAVAIVAGGPGPGALAIGVGALVTLAAAATLQRAFGGITGDGYGAVVKLVELSSYAVLAAALS